MIENGVKKKFVSNCNSIHAQKETVGFRNHTEHLLVVSQLLLGWKAFQMEVERLYKNAQTIS